MFLKTEKLGIQHHNEGLRRGSTFVYIIIAVISYKKDFSLIIFFTVMADFHELNLKKC
jgi:hypothetical protein